MKLPNVENAEIPQSKITKYLLSTTHRAGKSKASFFMQFGFDVDRWEALAVALKQHAVENEIALEEKTIFGTRYIINGRLKAPDGKWLISARPGILIRMETYRGSSRLIL